MLSSLLKKRANSFSSDSSDKIRRNESWSTFASYISCPLESDTHDNASENSDDYRVNLGNYNTESSLFLNNLQRSDFENIEFYGESTNSILYKADYGSIPVIIKMLREDAVNHKIALHEFEIEHNILKHSHHKNIVTYYGSGDYPSRFIVMEYLNQGTFGSLFDLVGVDFKTIVIQAKELAESLDYLHSKCLPGVTIIHRDLKPDNIGISNGIVKLFDFDLSACVKQRSISNEAYEMSGGTGTIRYMAPEVALGQSYNEKVDVYSFAILLWQLASHEVPFKGFTKREYMRRVVMDGFRPPMLDDWPTQFCSLLTSCWSDDAQIRPSFDVVVSTLEGILVDLH